MAEVHAEAVPRAAAQSLAPPVSEVGVLAWLQAEPVLDAGTTRCSRCSACGCSGRWCRRCSSWALLDADFGGTSREDCTSGGACWVFIKARFWQFMYGFYPVDQRWRVNLAFVLLIVALIPLFLPRFRHKLALAAGILVLYPIVAYCLFYGGVLGLPVVETALWGGLFLTLVIAGVGIVASLPLGILLALGPALGHADRARAVRRLHRADARRAADHHAVHGLGDAAAVPARRA